MTIRSTILVLAVPLFLLLALVNGALLYSQDRAEEQQALRDQALTAAVTVAEFLRKIDDPQTELAQGVRKEALRAGLAHVDGLDGLYLVEPGRAPFALKASRRPWDMSRLRSPGRPESFGPGEGVRGDRWVIALAPAGFARFVAVRFDADPIFGHASDLRRGILVIVVALGLFAAGLGLFVARRITRELEVNRRSLAGGDAPHASGDLRIREAQDLADALRLMDTSTQAAMARDRDAVERNESRRDVDQAIEKARSSLFAPCTVRTGDREIAMRICGDPPPGSFFAHAATDEGGTLVLGRCRAGTPIDALAAACDVRRLIERSVSSEALEHTLAALRAVYAIEALESCSWRRDREPGELQLVMLADRAMAQRAQAYCRANAGIAPEAFLAGLDIMLEPSGIFAAIGGVSSADGSERGIDIRLDGKDAAEAADVEHFAH
ncbi:hypothetical protein [Novosphingobium mangrovi (ex Huang et al. 2023)]|uniref:HAMP domain-containing protein n=1 Tax=Novosphingobium mangrovi (ex Huang et al. 2023) TaxID=2976432 RepID=A0ABT2I9P8_9SPHN|nr:hypothetical protein [Novosphingobium mangrovi (ex Huang et al. 2023)]MCT2401531.1 hypothetical protein [Novosphingobium mangrovi (ex Huang et al. 2023)]